MPPRNEAEPHLLPPSTGHASATPASLLSAAPDWWNNACIGFTDSEWPLYARGYKRAADILVMHVNECATDQDSLVYPILFLYRQHFELRLKHLIQDACRILDEEFVVPKTHRLPLLYTTLMEKLKTAW